MGFCNPRYTHCLPCLANVGCGTMFPPYKESSIVEKRREEQQEQEKKQDRTRVKYTSSSIVSSSFLSAFLALYEDLVYAYVWFRTRLFITRSMTHRQGEDGSKVGLTISTHWSFHKPAKICTLRLYIPFLQKSAFRKRPILCSRRYSIHHK